MSSNTVAQAVLLAQRSMVLFTVGLALIVGRPAVSFGAEGERAGLSKSIVIRSVDDGYPRVNVSDFDSVADGRTDCLEPIQKAIDAVSAGGRSGFPEAGSRTWSAVPSRPGRAISSFPGMGQRSNWLTAPQTERAKGAHPKVRPT